MTRHVGLRQLLHALGGDEDILAHLVELGAVKRRTEGYTPLEVERVLISYTLVRELGVNWEGVEVILRMQEELVATRRQVTHLLQLLPRIHPASAEHGQIPEERDDE